MLQDRAGIWRIKEGKDPCSAMLPLTLLGVLLRVNSFATLSVCIHSWYTFLVFSASAL